MTQDHQGVRRLDFLPYHFLLTSVGEGGILRYQVLHRPDPLASMLDRPMSPLTEACGRDSSHKPCPAATRGSPAFLLCTAARLTGHHVGAGHEHRRNRSAAQDAHGDVRCDAAEPLERCDESGPLQWRGLHVDAQHEHACGEDALPQGDLWIPLQSNAPAALISIAP